MLIIVILSLGKISRVQSMILILTQVLLNGNDFKTHVEKFSQILVLFGMHKKLDTISMQIWIRN